MPMAFEWNMPLDLAGPARLSAPLRLALGRTPGGGHSTIGEDRRFLSRESRSVKRMSCFFRRQNGRCFNRLVSLQHKLPEIASVWRIL
jgi:hypothetical protein